MAGIVASACSSPSVNQASSESTSQLLNAGVAALKDGNTQGAGSDFHAVLKLDPTNTHKEDQIADFDLGVIEQDQNDVPAAEADYQSAIKLDAFYVGPKYNLAIEETTSDPLDAISLYRQVITIQPSDVNAIYNLGLLLYAMGQKPEGQTYLAQAIQMAPSLAKKLPAGVTP
ncbi:MAG TPA: tetratricopeptide repeat protein [Acidimicrobiales bacterium]